MRHFNNKKTYKSKYHHFTEKELSQINSYLENYCNDNLEKNGNKWICPICGDKRAITQQSNNRPTFLCHSCMRKGEYHAPIDLVKLHQSITGLSWYASITDLAVRYLPSFSTNEPSQQAKPIIPQKKEAPLSDPIGFRLHDINHIVYTSKYHLSDYFQENTDFCGLTHELLKKYGVGYLGNWISPSRVEGIDVKKFPSKRFIFPETLDGQLVGYRAVLAKKTIDKGREGERKAMLIHSKVTTKDKTPLFLEAALDEEICCVVEGGKEAIMLSDVGMPTCSIGGCSCLSGLIHRLATAKTELVFLFYDNDELARNLKGKLLDKGQVWMLNTREKVLRRLSPYQTKEEEELDALCVELAKAGGYANFPKNKMQRLLTLANAPKEKTKRPAILLVPTQAFLLGEKDLNDIYKNGGNADCHFPSKNWRVYASEIAGNLMMIAKAYLKHHGRIKEQLDKAFYTGWLGNSKGEDKETRINESCTIVQQLLREIKGTPTDDGKRAEGISHEQRAKLEEIRLSFVEPTEDFIEAFNANQEARIAKILPPSQAAFDELL